MSLPTAEQIKVVRWLRSERQRRGLTQKAWGEFVGWSHGYCRVIETKGGAFGFRAMVKVAKRLRLPLSTLLRMAGL